ncbi:MAG: hypothetical protein AB7I79_04875 [Rhizobiaceae bacterium]
MSATEPEDLRHVERRLALIFPGFEPLSAMSQARRFLADLADVAPLYRMTADATEPRPIVVGDGLDGVEFSVHAQGAGWATTTDVVIYGLAALNRLYSRRNPLARVASGYRALAELAVSGALRGYVRSGRRFRFFFVYPFMAAVLVPVAAAIVAALADDWMPAGIAMALAAAAAIGIIWWLVRRLHLLLALDLWSYTRDLAERRHADVESIRAAAADDAARRVSQTAAPEVLFCGHSMGAVIALAAAAAARPRPDAGLGLLTGGGSIPQVGLDPAAAWLRDTIARLARSDVDWIDVQSKIDVINFDKIDVSRDLGSAANTRLRVVPVRFRTQLTPKTYRAIRTDMFRIHRQFVRAVEVRSHYSWHALICGPERFAGVRMRGGLRETWEGRVE